MTNTNSSPAIETVRRSETRFGSSPCCEGATATIDAEYSTREQQHPLGWTIAAGELVRYHYIRCGKCGQEQWS